MYDLFLPQFNLTSPSDPLTHKKKPPYRKNFMKLSRPLSRSSKRISKGGGLTRYVEFLTGPTLRLPPIPQSTGLCPHRRSVSNARHRRHYRHLQRCLRCPPRPVPL